MNRLEIKPKVLDNFEYLYGRFEVGIEDIIHDISGCDCKKCFMYVERRDIFASDIKAVVLVMN